MGLIWWDFIYNWNSCEKALYFYQSDININWIGTLLIIIRVGVIFLLIWRSLPGKWTNFKIQKCIPWKTQYSGKEFISKWGLCGSTPVRAHILTYPIFKRWRYFVFERTLTFNHLDPNQIRQLLIMPHHCTLNYYSTQINKNHLINDLQLY